MYWKFSDEAYVKTTAPEMRIKSSQNNDWYLKIIRNLLHLGLAHLC